MSFKYVETIEDWYLAVTPEGPITSEALADLGHRIKGECEKKSLKCALVNCEKIEGALELSELFFASQEFTKIVGPALSVAYINPPPQWNVADDQFSRNVINNRGGLLELFESREKAEDWLKVNSQSNN